MGWERGYATTPEPQVLRPRAMTPFRLTGLAGVQAERARRCENPAKASPIRLRSKPIPVI